MCRAVPLTGRRLQVGGFPRKAGMERKDVMAKNVTIYRDQASALAKNASKDVKVGLTACLVDQGGQGPGAAHRRTTCIPAWWPARGRV